jgi:hypothetical protein
MIFQQQHQHDQNPRKRALGNARKSLANRRFHELWQVIHISTSQTTYLT